MGIVMVSLTALLGLARPIDPAIVPVPATASSIVEIPAKERAAIGAILAETSRDRYDIIGARYFAVRDGMPWVAIVKQVDGFARRKGARHVDLPEADPGKKLIEIWDGPGRSAIGIAMLPASNNGAGTLAYLALQPKTRR